MEETWARLDAILSDSRRDARQRVERAITTFFESERDEAALRGATAPAPR